MKRNNLRWALVACLCAFLGTAACSESDPKTDDPGPDPGKNDLTAIRIEPSTLTLVAGEQTLLGIVTTPEGLSTEGARWNSSDTSVATVDNTGRVTAVAAGTTTIKAGYNAFRAECALTVTKAPVPLQQITVAPSVLTLKPGEFATLEATLVPADADVEGSVVWSSKKPDVATVDASGKVTALAVGTTEIVATLGDVSGSCALEVFEEVSQRPFTFFQLNIWEGLRNINNGLDVFIAHLVALKPDAASFCEFPSTADAERILSAAAAALKQSTGLTYTYTYRGSNNGTRGLLTRHKILSTDAVPSGDQSCWFYRTVIDFYGQEMALYASHAYHAYYACYLPRGYGDGIAPYEWNKIPDGPITDVAYILEREELSGRTRIAEQMVADMTEQRAAGRLAIFGGDLNQPSHLDWTEATKDRYEHNGCVVAWPISTYCAEHGIKDAFREIYPDPVTHPGVTWPVRNKDASKVTQWAADADERDRIDYVYFDPSAKLSVKKAQMVGPIEMITHSQPEADTFVNQAEELILPVDGIWPTDHRGLLVTFEIKF